MKIPFLFKDKEIPDFYIIELCYVDNKIENIEAVDHKIQPTGILDIITTEDTLTLVVLSSLKSIKFDKNLTKLVRKRNEKK